PPEPFESDEHPVILLGGVKTRSGMNLRGDGAIRSESKPRHNLCRGDKVETPDFVDVAVSEEIPNSFPTQRHNDFRIDTGNLQLQVVTRFLVIFLGVRD